MIKCEGTSCGCLYALKCAKSMRCSHRDQTFPGWDAGGSPQCFTHVFGRCQMSMCRESFRAPLSCARAAFLYALVAAVRLINSDRVCLTNERRSLLGFPCLFSVEVESSERRSFLTILKRCHTRAQSILTGRFRFLYAVSVAE